MTLNGITMGLIAEVLLLVTAVAISGTVQSQVRDAYDNACFIRQIIYI